ncbi:hypothetical protein [Rubrimonas cliftonensis]|uniref:Uncharacterized protein n=1 Tax=Rubrimonas cliftonensis TaxID=89524 RepID=A0A1H4G9Y4_9RHOB|nr:hypothetical protein [Rubrimonas cliftonensis]SEB06435.1 hypothetical protein SAMN05444370_1462 [Rubrimonas cliftonensis]
MSDYPHIIITALLTELLDRFAPALLAADAVCRRAAGNPGLARAQGLLATWLDDLRRGEHDDALAPDRLDAVLRALLVRAISRGTVAARGHPDHGGPVLRLAAEDLAVLEIAREIAATLDVAQGTAVVETYDAHREAMLDRIFAMAAQTDRPSR